MNTMPDDEIVARIKEHLATFGDTVIGVQKCYTGSLIGTPVYLVSLGRSGALSAVRTAVDELDLRVGVMIF